MTQEETFLSGEGDRWYLRNRAALEFSEQNADHDPVLDLLDKLNLHPHHVVEIGASTGYRLHGLHTRYGSQCVAVEPSLQAIEEGQSRYPGVQFLRGTASRIPIYEDYGFDLAIVNYVFHWMDRSALLRSVSEIDRLLGDGAYLVIGDFYPTYPQRTSYHHLPENAVWTYKQDYPAIFLASNLYSLAAWYTLDHSTHAINPAASPRERSYLALLRKSLDGQYHTDMYKP